MCPVLSRHAGRRSCLRPSGVPLELAADLGWRDVVPALRHPGCMYFNPETAQVLERAEQRSGPGLSGVATSPTGFCEKDRQAAVNQPCAGTAQGGQVPRVQEGSNRGLGRWRRRSWRRGLCQVFGRSGSGGTSSPPAAEQVSAFAGLAFCGGILLRRRSSDRDQRMRPPFSPLSEAGTKARRPASPSWPPPPRRELSPSDVCRHGAQTPRPPRLGRAAGRGTESDEATLHLAHNRLRRDFESSASPPLWPTGRGAVHLPAGMGGACAGRLERRPRGGPTSWTPQRGYSFNWRHGGGRGLLPPALREQDAAGIGDGHGALRPSTQTAVSETEWPPSPPRTGRHLGQECRIPKATCSPLGLRSVATHYSNNMRNARQGLQPRRHGSELFQNAVHMDRRLLKE